jgi:DNA adenine methylase
MTDEGHEQLAKALHRVKGMVAISGYRCDLMDALYKDFKRHDADAKICHSVKKLRKEALWVNY